MSSNKKGEFVLIVVLLTVFVSGTIFGLLGKSQGVDKKDDPSKESQLGNIPPQTNAYDITDSSGAYLVTYLCNENAVYCGPAYETVDDVNYHLDFYQDNEINTLPVIANNYVFIVDSSINEEYYRSAPIMLYNISTGEVVETYEAVKNYTTGIEGGMFIVKKNGKWGIISINNLGSSTICPFNYDFIGLLNVQNTDGTLVNDEFVAMNGGSWGIINSTGASIFSSLTNEIVNYNGQYLVAFNSANKQVLYNYSGVQLLNGNVYNKIIFVGRYIGIFDNSNKFYIYDHNTNTQISRGSYDYVNESDVSLEYQENSVVIKVNGQVMETVII